ncbi:GNAT family N-acetyltransferase [Methylomonas rhizoryzae]|uniref:GNAT family N-acetyltransferase n=1 Tax=Methylomonas rhizoryzae TaxID=2608981 RepID=UPI001231F544|nr:GNAT family N-acetyltransferase [Methylomonas rhizoryzae]
MKFERLQPELHDRKAFDCGNASLNLYLRQFANQDQNRGLSRVYVLAEQRRIVGYYSLSAYSVATDALADQTRTGAYRELPFLLLGRLAVDQAFQGQGLGDALIIHAFKTTVEAAEKIGIFGMIVDAKDERAAGFYEHFGFKRLNASKNRLVLPFSAIKKAIQV